MQYFSHLQTGVCTNEVGSYGDALHRPAIAVRGNFPEKSALVGEARTRNALKTRDLASRSFPKRFLLERVCCASCALSAIIFL